MTIGSIFLGLALLILVGLFITRALIKRQPRRRSNTSALKALQAQKEAVLTQILNLDFDYDTGKVPESEYRKLREDYMGEATTILNQLDALETGEGIVGSVAGKTEGETTKSQSAEIEAAIVKASELIIDERLSTYEAIDEAVQRLMPSTSDIEFMTKLAIAECNDIDLLPDAYREMFQNKAQLKKDIAQGTKERRLNL